MDLNQFTVDWHYPTTVRTGIGRIRQLSVACRELGMQSPMLVTDPGLAGLPMIKEAQEQCIADGLRCGLFTDIKANPTEHNVMDGLMAYRAGNHDGVIAFGGGSALDAGKAVALMAGQTGRLWDFEDVGDNWTKVCSDLMAPIVAVPTTAGTGSEVGRVAVITDPQQEIKRIIFHPKMLPGIVILDPALTLGLPPDLTAATGMDALAHALEAYCAGVYHPMAEGIALEAIRLVKEYLPRATQDGLDLEARCQMLVASTMGATAFQRGLGAMHALAHPLGAIYDSHHGLLNAILMPYVLKANQQAVAVRIERLGRYLNLYDTSFDGFLSWVLTLRSQLSIPHTLSDAGIIVSRIDEIGSKAYHDPCAAGNPIPFTAREYAEICLAASRGDLST